MKLTKATDKQIKELFAKMLVLTDDYPIHIVRNEKSDEIYVTFTTTWETRDGDIDIEDTITLSKDTLSETDFPCEDEMLHLYRQWLVATKLHSLFDNNPFIKKAHPTADVVEVRHGRWEKRTFVGYGGEIKHGYHCSECNTTWDAPTNHCPNCGVKMDGKG